MKAVTALCVGPHEGGVQAVLSEAPKIVELPDSDRFASLIAGFVPHND
jgi:hypothetical protein